MSIFDAPIARCEAIHEMVLTDVTQRQCAREHRCPVARRCLLQSYFTETSGITEDRSETEMKALHH